jgi:endonuclease YncB( thermonuclease family)
VGGVRKSALVVVVALFLLGACNGEDDGPADTIGDVAENLLAEAEAEEPTAPPPSKPARRAKSEPAKSGPAEVVTAPKRKRSRTYLVTRVIDGDTVELGNGESVRVVGIDTPERGECGYAEATAHMERLVLGKRIRLGMSDENRDRYDRLLRYVNIGRMDAGLKQINRGLAIARYDSRDGYGYHPRENGYIAADKATPNFKCAAPKQKRQPVAPTKNCAAGYSPCIPPYPPDLDCSDVNGLIHVTGSDPHGLDGDGDGVACE